MDTQTAPRTGLHPLVATAAIAVTLASLMGIAAMTGLLPTGKAKSAESPLAAPTTPMSAAPVVAPAPVAAPAPVVESAPAPRPAVRHAAKATPKPVHIVRHDPPPLEAQATLPPPDTYPAVPPDYRPQPAPVEPPYPAVVAAVRQMCADCGTVESMREISKKGEGTGLGAVAGGIGGLILGHQIGNGTGNKIATVLGAAGGAFAGNQIEKNSRTAKSWEISVRMDDGSTRTIASATSPAWRTGDHVRVVNGVIQADNR